MPIIGGGVPPDVFATQVAAARELLAATKRSLQVVDDQITVLQRGRLPIQPAEDVSSEHRVAWFGAVDSADGLNGIDLGTQNVPSAFGFDNPHRGIIRVEEDAAFVCTNVMVAIAYVTPTDSLKRPIQFMEGEGDENIPSFANTTFSIVNPLLRLTDGNTGRNLINGMTQTPKDLDRGAVPFSYLSSFRRGLGSNVKGKLFSEFTIPRAGTVRAEVFNMGLIQASAGDNVAARAFVTLFGFKVYGG